MFLTITNNTQRELRTKILKKILESFKHALFLSPKNLAARVNKVLIEWHMGELVDEEFVLKLKTEIAKYDACTAKLLYILFKQKIHGSEIQDEEYLDTILSIHKNIQKLPNMTLELFELPEVIEARLNF